MFPVSKEKIMSIRRCFLALSLLVVSCQLLSAAPVSLESLLDEMTDRASLARWPDPAYTCKQASSYDPRSISPKQPGWFANNDQSQYVRQETNDGRTEWVMMDAEGPGAIVRWWVTAGVYEGTIRVYIDGAKRPAIEANVGELVGGDALVGPPLSAPRANGRNLYLPIPYAKHCKVTFDRNYHKSFKREDLLYYQINYRTYAPGTRVESFDLERLAAAEGKIAKLQKTLLDPASVMPEDIYNVQPIRGTIEPGKSISISGAQVSKPTAICRLSVRLFDVDDLAQALRSTVLAMEFDGQRTVWCPVGDFFGGGVGVNPYTGWYRKVAKDGTMICWWVMPFRHKADIMLENVGKQLVNAEVSMDTCPWTWNDRSMYFHATWRQQRGIKTFGRKRRVIDWNYLTANGQGVFVGDTLALLNRAFAWWGEGDEKIYVDGESFPSHFGTGSEDYYGYAWCTPRFFESPFHAQPRAEGPGNYGNVTNTRVRLLDAIPFEKSFQFDIEVWHAARAVVDYAATTYWYGRPGAAATVGPMPEEAKQTVAYDTELVLPGFKILKRPRGTVEIQNMQAFGAGKWKDDDQLWWRGAKPGDRLTLNMPIKEEGKYGIQLNLTKAPDYATVQFYVDGEKAGGPIDLYDAAVVPADSIMLGPLEFGQGEHKLTVEITGAHPEAQKAYMVGIDQIEVQPAE
jgi:hypothetical protein